MKILELTNFSAGICGVFARVKQESALLKKHGHDVRIFSSNFFKGSNEIAKKDEKIEDVIIKRFPAIHLGGESFLKWDFENDAMDFNPDIIIAHSYRQLHTTKALKLGKKIGCKVFLVTHAPFARTSRLLFQKLIVWFYDNTIGSSSIRKFDKVIAITKWEFPYLIKLGIKDIEYIPNGIPNEFFIRKKEKGKNKILFLGRVSPIKNLEVIIKALSLVKDKSLILEVVGPAEKNYLNSLKQLIKQEGLGKKVIFSPAIYDLKEKIKKIDSAKIFILPSKSEGMPQSLIEAMAREKIVIASDNLASRDLIKNNENGFLFSSDNSKELSDIINRIITNKVKSVKIKMEAKKSVEQFCWDLIIKKIENLLIQ